MYTLTVLARRHFANSAKLSEFARGYWKGAFIGKSAGFILIVIVSFKYPQQKSRWCSFLKLMLIYNLYVSWKWIFLGAAQMKVGQHRATWVALTDLLITNNNGFLQAFGQYKSHRDLLFLLWQSLKLSFSKVSEGMGGSF